MSTSIWMVRHDAPYTGEDIVKVFDSVDAAMRYIKGLLLNGVEVRLRLQVTTLEGQDAQS